MQERRQLRHTASAISNLVLAGDMTNAASSGTNAEAFVDRLQSATRIITALGAVCAVGLMLYTGRHNKSMVLMAMFVAWVLAPFATFWYANSHSARLSVRRRLAFYGTTLILTLGTLIVYSVVALGPPRPKPAFLFLVVPPITGVLFTAIIAIARFADRGESLQA